MGDIMHYAQKEKIKTLNKLRSIISALNKPEGIDIHLLIAQASISLGISKATTLGYIDNLDTVGEIDYSNDIVKIIALRGESNGSSNE